MNQQYRIPSILREKISAKLIVLIILCSSLITFFITSVQIYIDYRNDLDQLQTRMDQINSSFNQSISTGMWNMSDKQVRNALGGILKLPDIIHLRVQGKVLSFEQGVVPTNRFIQKDFNLSYFQNGKHNNVGRFTITAGLKGIYSRLINKLVFVLLAQSFKTFLVSFFMFIIFDRLIVRHLQTIVTHIQKTNIWTMGKKLELKRKKDGGVFKFFNSNDELDYMTFAINRTSKHLQSIYSKLQKNRDNLELAVKERTEELRKKNKELELYDHSVAHDLKNPISSIKGYAEILDSYCHKNDTSSHISGPVGRIHNASIKTLDIIDGLLRLAKTGGRIDQLESVLIVDIIEIARQQLAAMIEMKQGKIVTELQVESILGDKIVLGQIFTNLISNALKYCPPSRQPQIRIVSQLSKDNSTIDIAIIDNSIGIPKEKLDIIFEERVRIDDKNIAAEGHGIGLATVRRLAESCNAKITVDSTYGASTTFTLHFPVGSSINREHKPNEFLSGVSKVKQIANVHSEEGPDERVRILLIDDDSDIQILVKMFLDPLQYDFVGAQTGMEGLRAFREDSFDVVMVDLQLGEMSGKDIIKQLRSNNDDKVIIIAFSAQGHEDEIKECFELGCDHYFQKPFSKESLNTSFKKILSSKMCLWGMFLLSFYHHTGFAST